jgi:signal transduction histidine kinase
LKHILQHLVANAVKFTPRGGTVALSARAAADGSVEIAVADTGIGMSGEEIALALQAFRQVDNSHTRKHQGAGLGLTLASAVAALHGGALEIASVRGQGTTATLRLPATLPAEASSGAGERRAEPALRA